MGDRVAASLVTAWAECLAGAVGESSQCPTLRRLEEYVTGRTALLLGGTLLPHVALCARCRHRLAGLTRMEMPGPRGPVWRLPDVRTLAGQGSERAAEVAGRVGEWLVGLAGTTPVSGQLGEVACRLQRADGRHQELPGRLLAPLAPDADGRLLLRLTVGLPPGTVVVADICLEDDEARLELFSAELEGPGLEAIVDLKCCLRRPLSLPPAALGLSLRAKEEAAVGAGDLTVALEMLTLPTFELSSIDQLLAMARREELGAAAIARELAGSGDRARSELALSGAADLLGRYLRMWATGNQGDIPEQLADLFTSIVCQLSAKPSAQIAISTSFGGHLIVPIAESVGDERLV